MTKVTKPACVYVSRECKRVAGRAKFEHMNACYVGLTYRKGILGGFDNGNFCLYDNMTQ